MPRPDPKKWATDTTQMLVAVLADENGSPVRMVRAHEQYNPARDSNPRVSRLFAAAALPDVYTPNKASKLHLKCANPDCSAKLSFVAAHGYENDHDGNRAHFRSRKVNDHAKDCMFKNPKRESAKTISIETALKNDLPIFVNIHFDTGFSGNTPVGQDYLSDHARWKMGIGSGDHAVVAIHTIDELIKLRDRVAAAGEEKLALLWYGKNTMVLSHEHFWLAPQTQEEIAQARDTRQNPAAYIAILEDILNRAEDPANPNTPHIHGRTRVVAFEGATGAGIYDASNRIMRAKPITLRGASMLNQSMELNFLKIDGYGVQQGKQLVDSLLEKGRRFLVAASPSITFSRHPIERARQMRELRAVIKSAIVSADSNKNFQINWRIDTKDQLVSAPFPARPRDPNYRSGAIPFGDLPFDRAATPTQPIAQPSSIAATRKDDVLKSAKPEQLKLL